MSAFVKPRIRIMAVAVPVRPVKQDADAIINALGGTSLVARLCKVKPPSVSEWRQKGIPSYRVDFLRLARPDVFAQLDAENVSDQREAA